MPSATITSKGQVTIPKKVRDKLGLRPGDKLNFDIENDGEMKVSAQKNSISKAAGILYREGQKPISVEEMDRRLGEYFRKKYKK